MKKILLTLFLGMSCTGFLKTDALATEIKPYNAFMHVSEKAFDMDYFFVQQIILAQNFDGNGNHNFTLNFDSNRWVVGNSVSSSAPSALYISNDAGLTNNYDITARSVSHAFTPVTIPANSTELQLSFDFKCGGEGSTDYMRVWLVPDDFFPTAGTAITIAADRLLVSNAPFVNNTQGNLNGTTNSLGTGVRDAFRNLTFTFSANNIAGTNRRLVFEWVNNQSGGNQSGAAVDNIFLRSATCKAPTNLNITLECSDSSIATAGWTAGSTETEWEWAVTPVGDAQPTTGTIVNEPVANITGLTPRSNYTLWVRARCGAGDESIWTSINFRSEASPVQQAVPFCSPVNGGLIFPNVSDEDNAEEYGQLDCLYSTPNPVWYYLTIENNGPVNFQIIQNTQFDANGNATGRGLDVDFIAWGPFDSAVSACEDINLAVPANHRIACSYSAAAIENFSIPNAQAGQIYVLLITNYNGDPGFIKLHQTNLNQPGAGQTDCSFTCDVHLPADVTACEGTSIELSAQDVQTGGDGTDNDITEIRWFYNGTLLDPNTYNTLTITADRPGTYRIEVEKVNCTEDYSYDEFVLTWVEPFKGTVPNKLRLCDYGNDNTESFDLNAYLNELQIPNQFSYTLHATQQDATNNVRPISGMYDSGNSTIYIRVSARALVECHKIFPITLELIPVNLPSNLPIADIDICTNYSIPELPSNQRFTHYIKYRDFERRIVEETVSVVNQGDLLPIGYYKIFVEAISEDNCVSNATHDVNIYECKVQSGISPNGDGLNDNLDLTYYRTISLKIYNRNGKEVYSHGPGYINQWVGQDNSGNELPDGTYFIDLITPFERFTQWIQLNKQSK